MGLVDKLNFTDNTFTYNNTNYKFDFNKINSLHNQYLDQYYNQHGNFDGHQNLDNFDVVQFQMDQMNQSKYANWKQQEDKRLNDALSYNYDANGLQTSLTPNLDPNFRPTPYLRPTAEDAVQELQDNKTIKAVQPPDEPSSFSKNFLKFGNFLGGGFGTGLNIAGNIAGMFSRGNESYNGPKGNIRASVDSAWNGTQEMLSKMGPYGQAASNIMQGIGALNKITNFAFGSTSGMTTFDALFDSPLGTLTGIGWINQAFKKKSDSFTKDEEVAAAAGNSLSGLNKKADDALEIASKQYGTFSSGARIDANRILMNMRTMQETAANNVAEANTARTLRDSMSAINNNRRFYGSSDDVYRTQVAKHGIKINAVIKPIKPTFIVKPTKPEFKKGGSIKIVKPMFKEGGTIEDPIVYSKDRFPILNNLPDVVLQKDSNFNPGHNIEYMEAKYDTLPYYNNYEKKDKGKSTIVYNDKATYEDIALDWLSHGLREYDENWNNYLTQLVEDPNWKNIIKEESFFDWLQQNKIAKDEKSFRALPMSIRHHSEELFNLLPINNEIQESRLDSLIRAMLVKPELRKQLHYNYPDDVLESLQNSPAWKDAYNYIFNNVDKFAKGGKFNVIPEGALHARLHHMDIDDITKKGIPVISEEDGEIQQQAEIEREEVILRLEVTEKLEELLKKYNENKDDQYAIEAGNLLVYELLQNTKDNTNNLI